MAVAKEALVADLCWVALAQLHRTHPERGSFAAQEIVAQVARECGGPVRPGVQPHISLHCVANKQPNSAQYRLFYRLEDGTYRLFRPGDAYHPDRQGKTAPNPVHLPEQYRDLLAWYETEYCRPPGGDSWNDDPVLRMIGVGAHLWQHESGDEFIRRERQSWDDPVPVAPDEPAGIEPDAVWARIAGHQGEEFETKTGLPFTYEVRGKTIRFHREGHEINKTLGFGDVQKALARCPLRKVTDISDCFDPSYLFGVLMDPRIRARDW